VGIKQLKDIPEKWYCSTCQNLLGNNPIEEEDVDVGEETIPQENDMNLNNIQSLPKSPIEKSKRKLSWNQYASAAYIILKREKRPISYKELTEIALKEKLIKSTSSTPTCSMSSALSTHANKGLKFRRVTSGMYALLDGINIHKELSEQKLPVIKRVNFRFSDR